MTAVVVDTEEIVEDHIMEEGIEMAEEEEILVVEQLI